MAHRELGPAAPGATIISEAPSRLVRPEEPTDRSGIYALLSDSFPDHAEALLVDRLRHDGDLQYSLVCTQQSEIIGYAGFSTMKGPFPCLGLGPVAVAQNKRCRGVARALIETGLRMAGADAWQAVFVLGNPQYYGRFGFRADLARGFQSPYAGPHLMAIGLNGKELPIQTGQIEYASAFTELD